MTTVRCSNCQAEYERRFVTCPYCRVQRSADGLARAETGTSIQSITRSATEAMLARTADVIGQELTRDIGGPLSVSELGGTLERVAVGQAPSLAKLEQMLDGSTAIVKLQGIALADLIGKGADDIKVVKRGLSFLRAGRYDTAAEWWRLNRQSRARGEERMDLLLLLLESFTHELSGNRVALHRTRSKISVHPALPRSISKGNA